jgi:hypothetical protein
MQQLQTAAILEMQALLKMQKQRAEQSAAAKEAPCQTVSDREIINALQNHKEQV